MTDRRVSRAAAKTLVAPDRVDRRVSADRVKSLIQASVVGRRVARDAVKVLVRPAPVAKPLTAALSASSGLTPTATTPRRLTATLAASGTTAANLRVTRHLAASLSFRSSLIDAIPVPLQAGLSVSAQMDANLHEPVAIVVPSVEFAGQGYLHASYGQGQTGVVAFTSTGTLTVGSRRRVLALMALQILGDTVLDRAPTGITVVVTDAQPNSTVSFYIDNDQVWEEDADGDGFISPVTLNVPYFKLAGDHSVRAEQDGSESAQETFHLNHNEAKFPMVMGPDNDPVDVPNAYRSNGTRAWVLQDQHPGGLGSYVMPINPATMTNPHLEKRHTTYSTTVPVREYGAGGQFHVMEGGTVPKIWTFEGYSPTKEMHEALQQFKGLNRRFYIIDHRRRGWIVLISSIEWSAKLWHTFNGATIDRWGHNYKVTATVLDQRPVQVSDDFPYSDDSNHSYDDGSFKGGWT